MSDGRCFRSGGRDSSETCRRWTRRSCERRAEIASRRRSFCGSPKSACRSSSTRGRVTLETGSRSSGHRPGQRGDQQSNTRATCGGRRARSSEAAATSAVGFRPISLRDAFPGSRRNRAAAVAGPAGHAGSRAADSGRYACRRCRPFGVRWSLSRSSLVTSSFAQALNRTSDSKLAVSLERSTACSSSSGYYLLLKQLESNESTSLPSHSTILPRRQLSIDCSSSRTGGSPGRRSMRCSI